MAGVTVGPIGRVLPRVGRAPLALSGVLLVVLVWWLLTDVGSTTSRIIPPLSTVIAEIAPSNSGSLAVESLAVTGRTLVVALVIALLVGLPLGSIMAYVPSVQRAFQPALSVYMSLPNVAFIPILIMLFGFGTRSVVGLGVLTGLPYIIANAQLAFQRVQRGLLHVGLVYCTTALGRFAKVTLPASLPTLASGTRIGAGRVLMGVVIGEMFGSNTGIGAQLVFAANFFDMPAFYVIFLTLFGLAGLTLATFQWLERAANRFG